MYAETLTFFNSRAACAAAVFSLYPALIAARVAFRNVLKDDADNIYREDILYYIAISSYKYASLSVPDKQKERYLTFVDDYFNFVGELPDSRYRRELDIVYRRAQRALGKNVAIDDEDLKEKK